MQRTILIILAVLTPSIALADCLPEIDGWLQIKSKVLSCKTVRAPKPAQDEYLGFELSEPSVSIQDCNSGGCSGSELYSRYIGYLENSGHAFLPKIDNVSCENVGVNGTITAKIVVQCCDTIQHQGTCKLQGPIIELTESNP